MTLFLALTGCLPSAETLDVLTSLRAEEMVEQALPTTRFALGIGALSAIYCGVQQQEWQDLEGRNLQIPEDVATGFGLGADVEITYDAGTGATIVQWSYLDLGGGLVGGLKLNVLRAMSSFQYSFTPDDDAREATQAYFLQGLEASVQMSLCSDEFSRLSLDLTQRSEDLETSLSIPRLQEAVEEEEDTGGAAVEGEEGAWVPGSFQPVEGDLTWVRGSGVERQLLESVSAAEMEGSLWPMVAASADWERDVEMELARD